MTTNNTAELLALLNDARSHLVSYLGLCRISDYESLIPMLKDFIYKLDRALANPAPVECSTCNDRREVGGHVGQTPEQFDYVSEPCPDCSAPTREAAAQPEAQGSHGRSLPFDHTKPPPGAAPDTHGKVVHRAAELDAQPDHFVGANKMVGDAQPAPPADYPPMAYMPDLPNWSKADDLGGLVPSDIRGELRAYAIRAVENYRRLAAGQQCRAEGVVVDEAAARRLDDYLGGEFDIRIGKQAAHAALTAALRGEGE